MLFHGYAGTSGAEFVSHIVADAVVVPPELASDGFLERVLYLAAPLSFFLVEDYPDLDSPELSADAQPAQALAQAYLPPGLADDEGGVLRVACFNNLYKLTPETFGAWMTVLREVPTATLWLLRMPAAALVRLSAEMAAAGVEQGRLVASDLFPRHVHLKVKSAATLFLDTLAYNAHSSAADSLAAGVPVVTCAGAAMPSRVASSLVPLPPLLSVSLSCTLIDSWCQLCVGCVICGRWPALLRSCAGAAGAFESVVPMSSA